MNKIINFIVLPIILITSFQLTAQQVSLSEPVEVTDIEQLLELVKDSATLRSDEDKKRLADFNKSKQRQEKLLADAKWLLKVQSNREKKANETV